MKLKLNVVSFFFGQESFPRAVRKKLCKIVMSPFWASTMAQMYKRTCESVVIDCGVFFLPGIIFKIRMYQKKVQKRFYLSPSGVSSLNNDTEFLEVSRN